MNEILKENSTHKSTKKEIARQHFQYTPVAEQTIRLPFFGEKSKKNVGKSQEKTQETIGKLRKYNSKKAFELTVPKLETHNGVKISSSRIRNLLNQGDIIGARECLGRDYMLSGTVVSGEKLGRKLGYPTANIRLEYDYPLDGVYLTRTVIEEKNYVGLASLGNKPTFNGSEKILEVFILDFDEDIYSQNIEVYFLEEIRKQIKFSNEDELIKQMNEDHKYAIINSKKYGI